MKSLTSAYLLVFLCIGILLFQSCNKESTSTSTASFPVLPDQAFSYEGDSLKATLGRVLFYDKALSINNSVSCGSCHQQQNAFADRTRFSKGFDNIEGERNTPPIQNLPTNGALFWDGRERLLQNMVIQPIFNHVEMGMRDNDYLLSAIKSRPYYAQLFEDAYGDGEVSLVRISESIQTFVGSIVSQNSEFDQSFGNTLNVEQTLGMNLFFGKYNCGSCHNLFNPKGYNDIFVDPFVDPITLDPNDPGIPSSFFQSAMVNIGLDADYDDKGMGALNNNTSENGMFKIPNLRNITLTAPYMHDGRFETLEEVIDHYSVGVVNHPNLDARLKDDNGEPKVFNITSEEKRLIISFLESLTDPVLISDPKFSDPFSL